MNMLGIVEKTKERRKKELVNVQQNFKRKMKKKDFRFCYKRRKGERKKQRKQGVVCCKKLKRRKKAKNGIKELVSVI